jgi:hypothetical protein
VYAANEPLLAAWTIEFRRAPQVTRGGAELMIMAATAAPDNAVTALNASEQASRCRFYYNATQRCGRHSARTTFREPLLGRSLQARCAGAAMLLGPYVR